MRTINIKTGRYDDVSPFLVTNNTLKVYVDVPNTNGEYYFCIENQGERHEYPLKESKTVELSNLKAGELHSEARLYLRGQRIATYPIEPLTLKEVGGSLIGNPEFVKLWDALNGEKENAKQQIDALSDIIKAQRDIIVSLVKFAYTDYRNNVYLTGEEDFFTRFGLSETDFTDEELSEIKED